LGTLLLGGGGAGEGARLRLQHRILLELCYKR
jgi:hypothetical protein